MGTAWDRCRKRGQRTVREVVIYAVFFRSDVQTLCLIQAVFLTVWRKSCDGHSKRETHRNLQFRESSECNRKQVGCIYPQDRDFTHHCYRMKNLRKPQEKNFLILFKRSFHLKAHMPPYGIHFRHSLGEE